MKKLLILFCGLLLTFALMGCGGSEEVEAEEGVEIYDEPELYGETAENIEDDFILITNANHNIEPRKMRVGDEFFGLVLTKIEVADLNNITAYFEGDMVLTGYLRIQNEFYNLFFPHFGFNEIFPNFAGARYQKVAFLIRNDDASLFGMLGLEAFEGQEADFENVTVRIGNISISKLEYGALNFADILEISGNFARPPLI